jgi:hypothetical protein
LFIGYSSRSADLNLTSVANTSLWHKNDQLISLVEHPTEVFFFSFQSSSAFAMTMVNRAIPKSVFGMQFSTQLMDMEKHKKEGRAPARRPS